MSPRPAPDLDRRRDQVVHAARTLAEAEGWVAVTMRRLAQAIGATQPVLYSAFDSRQAVVDAVALAGFRDIAAALEATDPAPMPRMRAYLDFAAAHPQVYEAMFSMPLDLPFAVDATPEPLRRAFAAVHAAFPDADGTWVEVAWAALHGLATLQAGGRLRASHVQARLDLLHDMLGEPGTH
jgi:AcrR family transcriptional regulator